MPAGLLFAAFVLVSGQQIPVPERPRDPWVFRSVLDKQPRMATIALAEEMWVAYDATHCGLYKAWKGGVRFDGAVYTTEHGPQPTSAGSTYTQGFAGPVWQAEANGARVEPKAVWRGYELHAGRVTLHYDLVLPDGRTIAVRETPEFVHPEDLFPPEKLEEWVLQPGHPGLMRFWTALEMPADVKLTVQVRVDGVTGKLAEGLERERRLEIPQADGSVVTQDLAHVVLTAQRPSNNLMLFFAPLPDPVPAQEGAGSDAKQEGSQR